MQKWLITGDTEKFNHGELFAREGFIFWMQYVNYNVGDIVYIYEKIPIGKVMFKTVVKEESLCLDENCDKKYAKLYLIEQVDKEELSLENLRNHGLKMPPIKSMSIHGDLEDYIDQYFDNK